MQTTLRLGIADLSAEQHGVFTGSQLVEAGCTPDQVRHMLRAGVLARVHRSVYRLRGVDRSFEQRALAGCLATGGAASGRTAARLYGLRGFDDVDDIEVTVEGKRAPRLEGVVARHTTSLQRTTIGVIPVVMPAQVVLGLCALNSPLAEGAFSDVLVRKLASLSSVVKFVRAHGASGRNGTARLRELVEGQVTGGAPTESWLEDRLLEAMRAAGLPAPVRQFPVESAPGRRLRIDLAHPAYRAATEADGRLFHTSPADRRRDAARDAALAALGWTVERVTWDQLTEAPEAVIARIARHLRHIKRAA